MVTVMCLLKMPSIWCQTWTRHVNVQANSKASGCRKHAERTSSYIVSATKAAHVQNFTPNAGSARIVPAPLLCVMAWSGHDIALGGPNIVAVGEIVGGNGEWSWWPQWRRHLTKNWMILANHWGCLPFEHITFPIRSPPTLAKACGP